MNRKFDIPAQRSFWLRCSLSAASWIFLGVSAANLLKAQVDTPGPERLSHVDGIVVNDAGHPLADVEVTLGRDGKVVFQTRTDQLGEFHFDHVKGEYLFRVARTQFAPAEREIVVTDEIVTALARKKLFVIAGPGACQDACSSILTSKREFDRTIRRNNRH